MVCLVVWGIWLGSSSCGTSQSGTSWRDDMALLFSSSSVQPTDPPRQMWTQTEEEILLRRLGHADCVAAGTTKIVSVYTALSTPEQLAMTFHPQEILHGSLVGTLDKEGDLLLRLTASAEEFQQAVRQQKSLAGSRYVIFLKKQPSPEGPIWRWALYRHDPRLISEIRAAYSTLNAEKKR
jgi:hypothetical protein